MLTPTAEFQINFLKYIQWLLETGTYTSTYKFALLISLTNVSIESSTHSNDDLFISYQKLAEQYIKLYWAQSLPFTHLSDTANVLHQNKGAQASIIKKIKELHLKQPNLVKAKLMLPKEWSVLQKSVADTIRKYPAKLLQSPENIERTFLYHYDKANTQGILLNTGIAYCLANFSGIIFKLCKQYWTDFVRGNSRNQHLFNEQIDLEAFLFGETRQHLRQLVPLLIDIQKGKCFYCDKPIKPIGSEVDHFIPWSKYPNDTAHNFVLADNPCNNSKRDYLASSQFYSIWLDRNQDYNQIISSYAIEKGFLADKHTSESISNWAYNLAVENEELVWQPPKKLNVINKLNFDYLL